MATAKTAPRHDCVGLSYYSAWMRAHGTPPVCIGFSSETQEPVTETASGAASQHETGDFKVLCIGYSSCNTSQSVLPHCEGIEVVVELPSSEHHEASTKGSQEKGWVSQPQSEDDSMAGRLVSKAVQNWQNMQKMLNNEGPVTVKPLPKTYQELQDRALETVQKNSEKMYKGAERLAYSAYCSTVKPLAAILGLTPRPKS